MNDFTALSENTAPLRVYMLGSGPIAVPVLRALAAAPGAVTLLGVGTQPDRPAGRKQRLEPTPLGAAAAELGIAARRWSNVNQEGLAELLRAEKADFMVVASFGQILKEPVLTAPRFGCVNIHASLLPRYRGASPIVHAILNGDRVTGVGFMAMDRGLDTGKVYRTLEMPLDGSERADTLETALGELAAGELIAVLRAAAAGELVAVPQDEAQATLTRKVGKSDGVIDFRLSAARIEAAVRAYAPWPGASLVLPLAKGAQRITVTRARVVPECGGAPGEIVQADRHGWRIACGQGALELLEIVPAGKKPMTAAGFLNGCRETLTGMRLATEL